jgi:hypothetical protein
MMYLKLPLADEPAVCAVLGRVVAENNRSRAKAEAHAMLFI